MGGEGHYMQVSSWKVPPGFKQNQTATKTPLLWLLKGSQLALEMFTADIVCEKMMNWSSISGTHPLCFNLKFHLTILFRKNAGWVDRTSNNDFEGKPCHPLQQVYQQQLHLQAPPFRGTEGKPFAAVVWKEDQQVNTVGEASFSKKTNTWIWTFAVCSGQFVVSSNLYKCIHGVHMFFNAQRIEF